MKVLLQRISKAELKVNDEIICNTKKGLLLFIGITHSDTVDEISYLVEKLLNLRIFEDSNGKMNLSIKDINGEILAVSQFTLYGNTKKGRRPSFDDAASPDKAKLIYDEFVEKLECSGLKIKTGIFGEHMDISFTNDGPVTLMLEK